MSESDNNLAIVLGAGVVAYVIYKWYNPALDVNKLVNQPSGINIDSVRVNDGVNNKPPHIPSNIREVGPIGVNPDQTNNYVNNTPVEKPATNTVVAPPPSNVEVVTPGDSRPTYNNNTRPVVN